MTRRALLGALVLALSSAAHAHVGSPTVIFEGSAGPYPVRVIVRPPEVVPGLADVTVRLLDGTATEITLQPIWWYAPKEGGAPPPDQAKPVRGEPALFTGSLWLMTIGSYAVRVAVAGAKGEGEVLVPVAALAARPRKMEPAFGALLLALGALLYAGSVSIVRASVGQAVVAPGEPARGDDPSWPRPSRPSWSAGSSWACGAGGMQWTPLSGAASTSLPAS